MLQSLDQLIYGLVILFKSRYAGDRYRPHYLSLQLNSMVENNGRTPKVSRAIISLVDRIV